MALADLNLNKWTLSVLVLCEKETAAQPLTPRNNEFLLWLDNWRCNEEGWGRDGGGGGGVMESERQRQSKGAPYFLVIAMGEGGESVGVGWYKHPPSILTYFLRPSLRTRKQKGGNMTRSVPSSDPICPSCRRCQLWWHWLRPLLVFWFWRQARKTTVDRKQRNSLEELWLQWNHPSLWPMEEIFTHFFF